MVMYLFLEKAKFSSPNYRVYHRPSTIEQFVSPRSEVSYHTLTTMNVPSCCCHPFLKNGHCLSSANDEECVSFASLVKYEHLDTVPVPFGAIAKIWKRAFPRHAMEKPYPLYLVVKDLFVDDNRAQHEAHLALLFQKHTQRDQ